MITKKEERFVHTSDFTSSVFQLAILRAYEKGYRITESGLLLNKKQQRITLNKNLYIRGVPDLSRTSKISIPAIFFASYCFFGFHTFEKYAEVIALNKNDRDCSKKNVEIIKRIPKANSTFSDWITTLYDENKQRNKKRKTKERKHPNVKFSDSMMKEIKDLYKSSLNEKNKLPGGFYKKVKSKYKMSKSTIIRIIQKVE